MENTLKRKIQIRKALAKYVRNKALGSYGIKQIVDAKRMLRSIHAFEIGQELPGVPGSIIYEQPEKPLPTLGKLRLVLEKEFKKEQEKFDNDAVQSDNDLKRLALKTAVFEYYRDLPYDIEVPVVDFIGCMVLRRDDKEVDGSDFDFAPNKSEIYKIWMEKLARYIRDGRLSEAEYDEAAHRGIPQGGAFEKQLDRYRKEFIEELWEDFKSN